METSIYRVWFTFKNGRDQVKRDFFTVRALNEAVAEIKGRQELKQRAYAAGAEFMSVGRYPVR